MGRGRAFLWLAVTAALLGLGGAGCAATQGAVVVAAHAAPEAAAPALEPAHWGEDEEQ
jgi:hypothetical protein